MQLKTVIFAAAVPLVALMAALRYSPDREPDEGLLHEIDSVGSESSDSRPERPQRVQRGIPPPPPIEFPVEGIDADSFAVTSADIEAIEMRLLAAIAEEFQESIERDIQRLYSFGLDSRAAEEMDRYLRDPAWPRISALPNVSGFEIQECPRSQCLSDWLAEETDDATWSRAMESRILGDIARHAVGGLAQVFAVCRQETCGILLPPSESRELGNLIHMGEELQKDLGFLHYSVANRSDFQAIYLTTRDQSPERWVQ